MSSANNYVVISSSNVSGGGSNYPGGRVTVTPLGPVGQQPRLIGQTAASPSTIRKILLKAVSKDNARDSKLFTLRNVKPSSIISCDSLRNLIRSQLSNDIVKGCFDVGIVQNNSAVSFRSPEDIAEVWGQIRCGKEVTLWCDGMISKKKKRACPSEEDEDEPKKKKSKASIAREDKVDQVVADLKKKHGNLYTPMQFRIWAEMIVGEVHTSHDVPPSTTMFTRAGSETVKRKSNSSDMVVQVVDKLASVLSPKSSSPRNGDSPVKVIESRSKCYKQLNELKSLLTTGVLTNEEYLSEKEAVMLCLKSLKPT